MFPRSASVQPASFRASLIVCRSHLSTVIRFCGKLMKVNTLYCPYRPSSEPLFQDIAAGVLQPALMAPSSGHDPCAVRWRKKAASCSGPTTKTALQRVSPVSVGLVERQSSK